MSVIIKRNGDPTQNVQDLTEAANKRQDDLRDLNNKFVIARLDALKSEATLIAEHATAFSILRAEHAKEIRELESNRLNAIRQVDVLAVNTAADRAAQAIQALAATTTANAENLRNALNSTATTIANQTANTVSAITERIAALEKSSYEGKGKQAFADPMMAELLGEVKSLREARSLGDGKSEGISLSWAVLIGVVGLIATIVGFRVFPVTPQATPPPQVIYAPAVPGTLMPQPTAPIVPR